MTRQNRRLFIFSSLTGVTGAVMGATALTVATPNEAAAQPGVIRCTDRDPRDPQGRGRGCRANRTDRDPYDRRGAGIRPQTDRDPYDRGGAGIRCTDYDARDPRNAGRWCRGRRR